MIKAGTLGTVTGVGVVTNITNGTIQNSGTVTGVGVVSMLTGGTINAGTIGTVTGVGVVTNITNGTIQNSGTVTGVGVISSLTTGSIIMTAGTSKNDGRPARNILSFGTTQVFAGSAFATLVGSAAVGAGTSIWVNDVSVVNHNGTVQAGIFFGSAINGTATVVKGMFGAQGGIQKSFPMAVNCGITNTDLNCWSDAAGTVTFNVSYFISA
jgi:hypothetical protein